VDRWEQHEDASLEIEAERARAKLMDVDGAKQGQQQEPR
jgi:hypothetical protein